MSAQQGAFLSARRQRVVALFPPYEVLRERLLSLGGIEVVLPRYDEFGDSQRDRQRVEVGDLLARGETWEGHAAVSRPMETNNCHANSASLYLARQAGIVTGWGLAEDGLWREHSWGITLEEPVGLIETTTNWLRYHGYRLLEGEARRFVRSEFGPDALP